MPDPASIARRALLPLLCLAAGGAAGYRLGAVRTAGEATRAFRVTREGGYRFVNPLLECERGPELIQSDELPSFREQVEGARAAALRLPGVEEVSVYFRELNDGLSFSAGAGERFVPASLRKVPMLVATLKIAEQDRALLDLPVPFALQRDHTAAQTFKPSVTLVPGQSYPVRELLRRMIVYSDNNAFTLLAAHLDPRELEHTYAKLDLSTARAAGGADLTVETYASFFRVLYNASYLGADLSEWALDLLSRTEFRQGIVKGVPGLTVAHKFGEHRDDATGRVQLHDCGIVYYPQHPYLLCVMSRGSSFEYLDDAIAAISRSIHAAMDAQHRR